MTWLAAGAGDAGIAVTPVSFSLAVDGAAAICAAAGSDTVVGAGVAVESTSIVTPAGSAAGGAAALGGAAAVIIVAGTVSPDFGSAAGAWTNVESGSAAADCAGWAGTVCAGAVIAVRIASTAPLRMPASATGASMSFSQSTANPVTTAATRPAAIQVKELPPSRTRFRTGALSSGTGGSGHRSNRYLVFFQVNARFEQKTLQGCVGARRRSYS